MREQEPVDAGFRSFPRRRESRRRVLMLQ